MGAAPDFVPDLFAALKVAEQIEQYGCKAWEPERDLTMVRQDAVTGEWIPGKLDRRRLVGRGKNKQPAPCNLCGGKPMVNGYCEGCSEHGDRYKGPYEIKSPTEDATTEGATVEAG